MFPAYKHTLLRLKKIVVLRRSNYILFIFLWCNWYISTFIPNSSLNLISFLFFTAKKRNRKSSPLRINLLKFYRLRWTKINSLRSDSIFVLTALRQNFLTRFLRGGRDRTKNKVFVFKYQSPLNIDYYLNNC